jgi:AraC-like DNA-binding protein
MVSSVQYYTIPAPPHLANYVRFFWVFEGDLKNGSPYIYRSMADGCAELLFHYRGPFEELDNDNNIISQSNPSAMLHGPSRTYRRFITKESFSIFGVYLYPFVIPSLFNHASTGLTGQMPGLDILMGAEGVVLEERVMNAKNNQQRIHLVCSFLEKKLRINKEPDVRISNSIQEIIRSGGMLNIEKLAGRYFISMRQFERKFKECSGFNPKLYTRIMRFHSVLKRFPLKNKSLTDIAYDCGYYDQSHFIHEFKEFSGYHPKTFFMSETEGSEIR